MSTCWSQVARRRILAELVELTGEFGGWRFAAEGSEMDADDETSSTSSTSSSESESESESESSGEEEEENDSSGSSSSSSGTDGSELYIDASPPLAGPPRLPAAIESWTPAQVAFFLSEHGSAPATPPAHLHACASLVFYLPLASCLFASLPLVFSRLYSLDPTQALWLLCCGCGWLRLWLWLLCLLHVFPR